MRTGRAKRSSWRSWGVRAVAAVLLITLRPALGQGTFGALPDPIGTRELLRLADRVGLSETQVDELERAHDAYKASFAALRRGAIAEYLRMERGRRFGGYPDRDAIEARERKRRAVLRRIEALDRELLDRMTGLLTEAQAAAMPRVRLARERARYQGVQLRIPAEDVVDLSALVIALDLPPDDRALIEPVIAEYETLLTARLRAAFEANETLDTGFVGRLEELGFDPSWVADAERAETAYAAMRAYWAEAELRVVGLVEDARGLSRRTADRLAATLPAGTGRPLRARYYRLAYTDLDAVTPALLGLFAEVASRPDLSAEQREALVALREAYAARCDVLLNQAADAVDAFIRSHPPFDFDTPEVDAHETLLATLETRAMETHRWGVRQLRDILGPAPAAELGLDDVTATIETAMGVRATAAPAVAAEGEDEVVAAEDRRGAHDLDDELLPRPITAREARALGNLLDAASDRRAVLDTLHLDYRERCRTDTTDALRAYRAARAALEAGDETEATREGAGEARDPERLVDRAYRLREAYVAALAGADEWFLEETATALPPEAGARLRTARARRFFDLGEDAESFPGVRTESLLDLREIVDRAGLEAGGHAALASDLADYDDEATARLRARYAAAVALMEIVERWIAVGAGAPETRERLGGEAAAAETRVAATSADLVALNRAHLVRLAKRLDEGSAHRMRRAYEHAAHPDVYDDPASVRTPLERARALDDLADRQRLDLDELTLAYEEAYARLSREMVAWTEPGDDRPRRGASAAVASLRFERDELNARTARRLRLLLTPAQRERLLGAR